MKTATGKSPRTRAKIIAELASLPGAIQGKICEDKRRLANGATAVYHNLQYWADGRNHTVRIPRDKLPAFREAVKGGATAKRLLAELTKADAESILSSESPLKKKLAQPVLRGAAKIHAVVDAAASSIERDGIACTSKLEQTLFDDMNGLCRELMAELLAAGAATARDYEPEADERNAGNHGKRIVTLFGELPGIRRTYYWSEDRRAGHYPFDDGLGLVGRYTPAAANEMARYAVSHPYRDAAEAFSRCHAFKVSPDTIREIVGMRRDESSAFVKGSGDGTRDADDEKARVVCVMADGTGMPMRKECLKGAKGRDGRAKTREVKAGAIFVASKTKDNEPHRDLDTTTYVATTHRTEKFGKLVRAEFDRRFGQVPETTLYITDGSKWLQTVWRNHFPFATPILDVYHALEHLKPMMLGLGIREGSKEWKYRHHYWSECVKAGKTKNVLDYVWKNMRGKLSGDAMREYRYYRGNLGRMKYDEYRRNGWFIGSGVIESACKTVIGQRFKQSGMFWSLKGAKALLPLRTLHKSNRLEEFFAYLVRDLRQVDCAA